MKKNYTFNTQKGAAVELTINIDRITSEKISVDGHVLTIKACDWKYTVDSIKVNGKSYHGVFHNVLNTEIRVGMQGNQPILVSIPDEIRKDFMAEEIKEVRERAEKQMEADKKYMEHKEMIIKAMEEF